MNEKKLWDKNKNKYYSYHDIYSYKNKDILSSPNSLISEGKNNIYCMCHGKNEDKAIKMHTRKLDNGYYTLIDNKHINKDHALSCVKRNEDAMKKIIISKGRSCFENKQIQLDVRVEREILNSKKPKNLKIQDLYSDIYGLGEYILAHSSNEYTNIYGKLGTEKQVLSFLNGYYNPEVNQGINTFLNNFKVDSNGITLGNILFNPKWIKCDEKEDKTWNVINSFREVNKRLGDSKNVVKQYLLLKYTKYHICENNLAKIELYVRGKNTKHNYDKKIYVYMDKFKFFKLFNMYKVEGDKVSPEYYVSALVYENDKKLFVDDIAFIPVYPNYCIPVDTTEQLNVLNELISMRNRLTIKRVAKIDNTFNTEFNDTIPDFIVSIIGTNRIILIELFNYIFYEYYKETLDKTRSYSKIIKSDNYEFLGIYNNLSWGTPPLSIILSKEYKSISDIDNKVEKSIKKVILSDKKRYSNEAAHNVNSKKTKDAVKK